MKEEQKLQLLHKMIGKRILSALIAFLRAQLIGIAFSLFCYFIFYDKLEMLSYSGTFTIILIVYLFLSSFFLLVYFCVVLIPLSFFITKIFSNNNTARIIEAFLPVALVAYLLIVLGILNLFENNFEHIVFILVIFGILIYTATIQFVIVVKKREYNNALNQ